MKQTYVAKGLAKVGKLPPVNYNDVANILQQLFSQSGGKISTQTQNDVRFDVNVQDYLNIQVGVPAAVNTLLRG